MKSISFSKNTTSPLPTIVFVHLLDDLSGSPRVLASVAEGLNERGWPVEIWTSKPQKTGFLSALPFKKHFFKYQFKENKWLRLGEFLKAQATIFRGLLQYRHQNVVIYVNTLLPFGAALAGWMMGKKVVWHLHEATVKPAPLRRFLHRTARLTASRAFFVSHFLKQEMELGADVSSVVIPNGLAEDFFETAKNSFHNRKRMPHAQPNCLMICSLKAYKGVHEFVKLAHAMPYHRFQLVLNADLEEIRAYFDWENLPSNLVIFPRQSDVHSFYHEADLVLNLSRPEGWIESFGMTLLEAMAYGLPVIAPLVGGQVEFIEPDVNGQLIDSADTNGLVRAVHKLTFSTEKWQFHSENAHKTADQMRASVMQNLIAENIEQLTGIVAPQISVQKTDLVFDENAAMVLEAMV
jgi:L-malate glycosyltransferase